MLPACPSLDSSWAPSMARPWLPQPTFVPALSFVAWAYVKKVIPACAGHLSQPLFLCLTYHMDPCVDMCGGTFTLFLVPTFTCRPPLRCLLLSITDHVVVRSSQASFLCLTPDLSCGLVDPKLLWISPPPPCHRCRWCSCVSLIR